VPFSPPQIFLDLVRDRIQLCTVIGRKGVVFVLIPYVMKMYEVGGNVAHIFNPGRGWLSVDNLAFFAPLISQLIGLLTGPF
jgi:hypothetical protein